MKSTARRRGFFTFIEIMVVVIIIGVLAAIIMPKFFGRTEQAKINAAKTQIGIFSMALDAFQLDNDIYPSTEQGLQALVVKPNLPPLPANWKGPYLANSIPLDPWGGKYVYKCPGERNQGSYDISSAGPDGKGGGGDDIANWQKTESRQSSQ
jgi:general secretion pathway protein G